MLTDDDSRPEGGLNTLLVSYDLFGAGRSGYSAIVRYLTTLPNFWHHLDSTWLVVAPLTAEQLLAEVVSRMPTSGCVLVINTQTNEHAKHGFNGDASAWLDASLSRAS